LISPKHRVIRKKFQSNEYVLEPIEDILKLKSPVITPVAAANSKKDIDLSDEQIKLMAWIIGEGSIERPGKNYRSCYRVSIYQSEKKKPHNYKEIKKLLNHFNLKFSEYTQKGLGEPVKRLRLNADSSKVIHKWFNTKETVGFIPPKLLDMSQRQSELFLKTYLKAEGFEGCKIATSDIDFCDKLQAIASNAGYGSTVLTRAPTIGTKPIFVIRLIKHKDTYIQEIKKVDYSGVIWCPNTENETVIARRNGKVFITGNTPFTNITMDLEVPKFMKDEPVIIGGKPQQETYGEFQEEMNLLNKAFAEIMSEGDANGRVFTFPIPTYNITKGFDWDNEYLKPVWEMTAKYGIPYFSNFVNSDMNPDDVRSMCCRLRLDNRELRSRGGGLFGANPLTGSIGVVTINLPRLGYVAKSEEDFFNRLSHLMDLAQQSLVIKRKTLERLTDLGLFPYSKFYLRDIKKRFDKYWKNHFSTIGLIGMNECCLNFLGSSIGEEEGKSFALKVMDFMRDKLTSYQEKTGDIYNLEATPAESTSYRLAKIDRRKFPDIIVANNPQVSEGSEPYYTNSSQLPVDFTDDIFEALDLQDPLQVKYTGGTVLHIFAGEQKIPVESVKSLVKKVAHTYHLPYFTLSPTFSICPEHGYIYGEHHKCPKCAEVGKETECEVFARVVGYLRPVKQWNEGKQAEFSQRKLFDKKIKETDKEREVKTD
jgi:ribonucleoside-triphosphate reductase